MGQLVKVNDEIRKRNIITKILLMVLGNIYLAVRIFSLKWLATFDLKGSAKVADRLNYFR